MVTASTPFHQSGPQNVGDTERSWRTGNHEARVLATMVGDPIQLTQAESLAWADALDNHIVTDAFAKLASRTRDAARQAI